MSIEEAWREFEAQCVSDDTPDDERSLQRATFYAGAGSALAIVADAQGRPDSEVDQIIQRICDEIAAVAFEAAGTNDGVMN